MHTPIKATNRREKVALRDALAEHDPEFLKDLLMMGGILGRTSAVEYLADDSARHAAVSHAYRAHLSRLGGKSRVAAQKAIDGAKSALK